MKKILIIFVLFFLWGCQKEKEKTGDIAKDQIIKDFGVPNFSANENDLYLDENSLIIYKYLDQKWSEIGMFKATNDYKTNIKSINHRGYSTIAPENTLSAYRLSYEKGFKYVETDVSFTKDNIPVLLHDNSINRTSNGKGQIKDLTFDYLRTLDFSFDKKAYQNEKIPSFEEFIVLCKNFNLHPYIEIKFATTVEQVKIIVDLVNRYGMTNNVTYISFYADRLNEVKRLVSKARLGFLCDGISEKEIEICLSLQNDINEVFLDTNYQYLYGSNKQQETNIQLELAINNKIPVEVWTVDKEEDVLNLDPYISGVTSNCLLVQEIIKNK